MTARLRERLHRWQQIESLCGFPVMKNVGLPSLTATLYPDSNWMLMPRSAMQSYQAPVSVEDMEEDIPQIIPQIPGWYLIFLFLGWMCFLSSVFIYIKQSEINMSADRISV